METPSPERTAENNGLVYATDESPGITRHRWGRGFRYKSPQGKWIRSKRVLERLQNLVIPPAWEGVWISPDAAGHLQATGFDARGRKQYLYHEKWTAVRSDQKFDSLADFARALPTIRRRVRRDLKQRGLPRTKVVACVVRLLDQTLIRVGNDEYARENNSYGLTTIRRRHVSVNGREIQFRFRAKGGKSRESSVNDPMAAEVVRRCQELPNQELFQYLENGTSVDITSTDINNYLFDVTGRSFTAKDFRTWGGTVAAAEALDAEGPAASEGGVVSESQMKKRERLAVRAAAEALGNTMSTCRQFYVCPVIASADSEGRLQRHFEAARRNQRPRELTVAERAVLRLLENR